jgi:hypothetical protein
LQPIESAARPDGRTDFDRAFAAGAMFVSPDDGPLLVQQVCAGDLIVPSGQLIACDPCYLHWPINVAAFTQVVAPGRYPVWLALARPIDQEPGFDRVACALIRFADAPIVRWTMALRPDEDPTALPLGHFYGHGVDSGTSCFVDAMAVAALNADETDALFRDRLIGAFERDGWATRSANVGLRDDGEANLIAFSSGYGDGAYPSWWGLDAAGAVCALATDFHVLVEDLAREAQFPVRAWAGRTLEHPDFPQIGMRAQLQSVTSEARSLRVVIDGGDCDVLLRNSQGDSLLSSSRLTVSGGRAERRLDLAGPLPEDAMLVLRYSLGIRGL